MQLADLVQVQVPRLVAHGSVRARDALDGVDVQVDPVGQQPRRELGRVQRGAGEEQVDGDVTRDLGEIAAQPRGFLEAARREVLPDRRQPAVPHAVPRDVRVVDVPVVGERVGAGRQVVEPDAARAPRVVLLVFGSPSPAGWRPAATRRSRSTCCPPRVARRPSRTSSRRWRHSEPWLRRGSWRT